MEHVHSGRCEHVFPGLSRDEAEARNIVDIITEFDDDYIVTSYVHRMVARMLGHAGLALPEARVLWGIMDRDESVWHQCIDSFQKAST